jgi:ornithine carbamoyltransferase
MARKGRKRDLLTLLEFGHREVAGLLKLAAAVKRSPRRWSRALAGKTLAMIFDKSSTRTRVSFETGMVQLGGHPLHLSGQDMQLGRGETVADTARVLSRYVDGIMIRTYEHARVEVLAHEATIPVINGLTDTHHPCQALADLLTLQERFGRLRGLQMAYVGDGNNVAHSLLIGCALAGVHLRVACPKGYEPDRGIYRAALAETRSTGSRLEVLHSAKAAVKGAHAVYTDTWTSMGQEAERAKRLQDFRGFRVTAELMAESPGAVFLHCLPAHRGEEVSAEVIDGDRSAVWDQAENRLHAQKAVLLTLMR